MSRRRLSIEVCYPKTLTISMAYGTITVVDGYSDTFCSRSHLRDILLDLLVLVGEAATQPEVQRGADKAGINTIRHIRTEKQRYIYIQFSQTWTSLSAAPRWLGTGASQPQSLPRRRRRPRNSLSCLPSRSGTKIPTTFFKKNM